MVRRVVFLLTDGFDFFSFSAALDTLRLANRAAGRELFTFMFLGFSEKKVISSIQNSISVETDLVALHRDDLLILCSGSGYSHDIPKSLLGWVRRQFKTGLEIISLHKGTIFLAKTGLLDGKSATIHWEHFTTFQEIFPKVELKSSSICVDGRISTTAGGMSSSKRILQIIDRDFGNNLKLAVADLLLMSKSALTNDQQRMSHSTRFGTRNKTIIKTISVMESNLEDPIPIRRLANLNNISSRQMERLFRKHLHCSPHQFYLSLRLSKASVLLIETSLTITQIAIACGFVSPSHFSKCYRKAYGETPHNARITVDVLQKFT
jgi:transcriptional regulator GlxA family with amidase domain